MSSCRAPWAICRRYTRWICRSISSSAACVSSINVGVLVAVRRDGVALGGRRASTGTGICESTIARACGAVVAAAGGGHAEPPGGTDMGAGIDARGTTELAVAGAVVAGAVVAVVVRGAAVTKLGCVLGMSGALAVGVVTVDVDTLGVAETVDEGERAGMDDDVGGVPASSSVCDCSAYGDVPLTSSVLALSISPCPLLGSRRRLSRRTTSRKRLSRRGGIALSRRSLLALSRRVISTRRRPVVTLLGTKPLVGVARAPLVLGRGRACRVEALGPRATVLVSVASTRFICRSRCKASEASVLDLRHARALVGEAVPRPDGASSGRALRRTWLVDRLTGDSVRRAKLCIDVLVRRRGSAFGTSSFSAVRRCSRRTMDEARGIRLPCDGAV